MLKTFFNSCYCQGEILDLDDVIMCVIVIYCLSVFAAVNSDQFLFSWRRFLCDIVSLCEREAVILLTVVNSCIVTLNATDGQSEVSPRLTPTKTIWNSWLTGISIINQEFRSFSSFLKIPLQVITNTWTGFTSDRNSLSWSNRLSSRRLSQGDFSWWICKTWKRGKRLLRQIQL